MGKITQSRLNAGALMTGVVASISLVSAHVAAQEPPRSPWRAELQLHGAWLPGGFEARGGVGVGLAARFHGFEAGPELWRYHLTLEDTLVGERQSFGSTLFVPLRVGYQFRSADLPVVVGAAASLGLMDSPDFVTGYCASHSYFGWTPGLRGFVGLALGHLMVGPHVSYSLGPGASGGACFMEVEQPDPLSRHYPARLPFGLQLGLTAILAYPR